MLLPLSLLLPAFLHISGAARNRWTRNATKLRLEDVSKSFAPPPNIFDVVEGAPPVKLVDRKRKSEKCEHEAAQWDWIEYDLTVYLCSSRRKKCSFIISTKNDESVKIQLGTGALLPGFEKGLFGSCEAEMLFYKSPMLTGDEEEGDSDAWMNQEEKEEEDEDIDDLWPVFDEDLSPEVHWARSEIEVLSITPFSLAEQFKALDKDSDGEISVDDLVSLTVAMTHRERTKWPSDDIDPVHAIEYFLRYFDINGDGVIGVSEFVEIVERDEKNRYTSDAVSARPFSPGFQPILDINNDGIISQIEIDDAARLFDLGPTRLPNVKDEL